MNENLRWHVVFTRQQCEKKVVLALTNKGYQCYCPQHTANALWRSQDKTIYKPLFSSYVFVRCSPEQFFDIKKTPGIINFMYRLNQPAVVSKEDMAALRQATGSYHKLQVIKSGWRALQQIAAPDAGVHVFPLQSLGVTLLGTKENKVADSAVVTAEPKGNFLRFSSRFRLAWR